MALFEGRFQQRFTVRAPMQTAVAWFADPSALAGAFPNLERWELQPDGAVLFQLREQHYGVTRFRGSYVCHYKIVDPQTVRWSTQPGSGNINSSGTARFSPSADGSLTLDYQATVAIDLDVGRLLARTLRPVIGRAVAQGAGSSAQHMLSTLQADALARR